MNHPSPRLSSRRALFLVAAITIGGIGACKADSPTSSTSQPTIVGSIAVTVKGLPAGSTGDVSVQGPSGYAQAVTATTTLDALAAGTYTIAARDVTAGGVGYAPSPATQTVVISGSAGGGSASATVQYAATAGSLTVSVSGLPSGVSADVTVTGPNSYSRAVTATTTLGALGVGTYSIAANSVKVGTVTYAPTVAQPDVAVTAGGSADGSVAYAPQQQTSADLTVDGAYIVQSVQRLDRSVPLVAGKDGVLRVFVRSSEWIAAMPSVRARLYANGQLVRTLAIAAPSPNVPTGTAAESEASLGTSWNVLVPGGLITPGLSVRVDVDPENAVGESNEGNNAYPADGPAPLAVAAAPLYRVRFVPIVQPNSVIGDVSSANVEQFLSVTRRMHPVLDIDADVRDAYTVSYSVTSDNANNSWSKLLGEIDAKRVAEGTDRDYYGVLKTTYRSGIAGLGYVPGHAAIGWDYLTTGTASEVMAHEIGHNWNRLHSPCGSPGGADPAYPYASGATGAYGIDVTLGANGASALKPPTTNDIMGYCSGKWISDYTYKAIQSYRASGAASASSGSTSGSSAAAGRAARGDATVVAGGAEQPCLLIWGRVVNGQPVLEPAFAVTTRPSRPRGRNGGPFTLRATSASGATLWSLSFAGTLIADTPNRDRTFAFAIPVSELHADAVTALRLEGAGQVVTAPVQGAVVTAPADTDTTVRASRGAAGFVRLRWNVARHAVLMVRDPRSGAVLAFARGGDATVRAPSSSSAGDEVEVALPNQVRDGRRRLRVGASQ